MILLGALLLANCSGDFEQETGIVPSHSGQVSFLFGLQQDDASVVQTRGSKPEQITRMWYAIANERGEIIKPLYQKLEENFSKLTIEGLSMGDYTVVFLATTSEEEDEAVKEPEKLSDDWLINHAENAPLDATSQQGISSGENASTIGFICTVLSSVPHIVNLRLRRQSIMPTVRLPVSPMKIFFPCSAFPKTL